MRKTPKLRTKKDKSPIPQMNEGGIAGAGSLITALSLFGALVGPSSDVPLDYGTDAIHATVDGNFRGNYHDNTGVFRPDQQNTFSPDGMHRGNYYAEGGSYFGGNAEVLSAIPFMPIEFPDFEIKPEDYGIETKDSNRAHVPVGSTELTSKSGQERGDFAFNHFVQNRGISPIVAAGIVGNLMHESAGFADSVIRTERKGDGGKAHGIAQWHPDRWKAFMKWSTDQGKHPYDLKTQLDYVIDEPGEGQKAINRASKASTVEEATKIWGQTYERPSERINPNTGRTYADWRSRSSHAISFLQRGSNTKNINDFNLLNKHKRFEQGGEYEMSHTELLAFIANGGEVDYL